MAAKVGKRILRFLIFGCLIWLARDDFEISDFVISDLASAEFLFGT